ncbi:response regulator transcription factor [Rhizobium lusitanum]|uniref:Two-component system, OmpR family, response regulator n=1 Tax=Rhizobium lusitanum TaxID=293958 RepID=A0A1C3WE79_9HYPH|nr:response regulator transcription factor [Rhizobium lusitanum]SCB38195.1 two-component system, OmpR family, response regulator [Rhizobium lusitanum]
MRILVVEDDPMLALGLRRALTDVGMSVDWVADGRLAEEAMRHDSHAAVLLDLSLPAPDGLTLLRDARFRGSSVPIVVITARDDLDVRLKGLDLGADDFVLKPFEPSEIIARLRAVIRRRAGHATSKIGTSSVVLDLATHELSYNSVTEVLPYREFALMRALLERPGVILSRSQLEEKIYGWGEEVESNAVEVLIFYIRRRFDKQVIRNVRGAGWMVPKS